MLLRACKAAWGVIICPMYWWIRFSGLVIIVFLQCKLFIRQGLYLLHPTDYSFLVKGSKPPPHTEHVQFHNAQKDRTITRTQVPTRNVVNGPQPSIARGKMKTTRETSFP